MGANGKRALFETLRSIDSATFTGVYQAVGTPLLYPSVLMKFVNNTSSLVTVSIDGVNAHDILPADSFSLYDYGSDAQDSCGDHRLALGQGTQIWVKASAGAGSFYVVTIYQGP